MKKNCSNRLALSLAALGTPTCTTGTASPAAAAQATGAKQTPFLVRHSMRNETTMQALFLGRLHADVNGCLRAGNATGPIIIWYRDTRIERMRDGRVRIIDTTTGNAVHVGDEIALSGSYRAGPVTNITEPVPQACRPQSRFFVAGRVMSEAQRRDILERQRNRSRAPSPLEIMH